jgi:tetratricopeptide (TPR) repeat protein
MFRETSPDLSASQELTAKTLLQNGRQRATDRLSQTPDLMAELLQYIGNAQANISDRTAADQTFSVAVNTYQQINNRRGEMLVLLDQIDNLLALGRREDARTFLSRAAALHAPFRNDAIVTGALLRRQAYVAEYWRDWPLARSYLERYLTLADSQSGMPPMDRVEVLENLATVLAESNDLPAAMALIERALQTLREHPDLPVAAKMDVLNYRQDIEYKWGRYADIHRLSPNNIQECDRNLNRSSSICLQMKIRLQDARLKLGLFDEARALNAELAPMLNPASPRDQLEATAAIARTLALSQRIGEHPELVDQLKQLVVQASSKSLEATYQLIGLNALAEVHVLTNQPAEALRWVARAEPLASAEQAVPSGQIKRTQLLKGTALHMQGQHALALAAMAPFCSSTDHAVGMQRVQDHFFSLNCVAPLVANGQTDAAISLLQEALPVLRENLASDAPSVQRAQQWLGNLRSGTAMPPLKTDTVALFD